VCCLDSFHNTSSINKQIQGVQTHQQGESAVFSNKKMLLATLNDSVLPFILSLNLLCDISNDLPKSIASIFPLTLAKLSNTFDAKVSVKSSYCSESYRIISPEKFKMLLYFSIRIRNSLTPSVLTSYFPTKLFYKSLMQKLHNISRKVSKLHLLNSIVLKVYILGESLHTVLKKEMTFLKV